MSAPGFRQLQFLLAILLLSGCAGSGKILESRGSEAIRKLPFCGVSSVCADERTAREEARLDALSQIAMFDGVGVDYSLLAKSLEKDGQESQSIQSNVSVLSRSLIKTLSFEYYLEISKAHQGKHYKAWCHIPWSEEIRESFLRELTGLVCQPVTSLDTRISREVETDPESYIAALSRAFAYYTEASEQASRWFLTPNSYTAVIQSRLQNLKSEISSFYGNLNLSCSSPSPNRMHLNADFQGIHYKGRLSIDPSPQVIDTLSIIDEAEGWQVVFSPLKSGEFPLRYHLDGDLFPLETFSQVIPTPLKLEHPFAGSTVGISCLDGSGYRPETAAALANLVTSLEGKVIKIESHLPETDLSQAAKLNCQYLISAVAGIAEIRENPQQGLFIAFPTLDIKIQDLASEKNIFAARYPNSDIPDLRARGKTKDVAIQEGFAFHSLFSDPLFIKAIRSVK